MASLQPRDMRGPDPMPRLLTPTTYLLPSGNGIIGDPDVALDATATPADLLGVVTIGPAAAAASSLPTPAVVAGSTTIGGTAGAGAAATPAVLAAAATLPTPAVTATALAVPAGISRPAPTISAVASASSKALPAVVAGSATVPAVTVTGTDNPPTAPTGLTSTAIHATDVDLVWNPATDDYGVTSYEVVIIAP